MRKVAASRYLFWETKCLFFICRSNCGTYNKRFNNLTKRSLVACLGLLMRRHLGLGNAKIGVGNADLRLGAAGNQPGTKHFRSKIAFDAI